MTAGELLNSGLVQKGFAGGAAQETAASQSDDENSAADAGPYGLGYQEGDTVKHVKFGAGKVISVKDAGRDFEVTVEFENYGVKKLFAMFAKLKKV